MTLIYLAEKEEIVRYCVMMTSCNSKNLEDIEDLLLPESVDAHQNKKYVLPRTSRNKTSVQQQAFGDSIIPGNI